MSLFGGRRPLRPILGTQALAQVMVEVRSEDELRRALTPKDVTASPTVGTLLAGSGRRIVIAAPITLKPTPPRPIAPGPSNAMSPLLVNSRSSPRTAFPLITERSITGCGAPCVIRMPGALGA